MRIPFPIRLIALGFFALIAVSVATAFAAGITVPSAKIGSQSIPVTAEDLKPAACNGITLAQIVSGTGALIGTSGNDLIIGSSGADIIDGLGGDDCIIGSGGIDIITGGSGSDVCLGGPGIDIFLTCEVEVQ